uniref:Uncharacterized protein n=1 Tax=Macaca fascicularis TaxID=9541 RepID=A0A7N9CTZ8_MACFA
MGQDTLLHGETLFVVPTTDSDHITLPFFTQSVSSNFCGHTLLIKSTVSFIVHFNEFLAASGWEGDVQLHLEAAERLQGATEKSGNQFYWIRIRPSRFNLITSVKTLPPTKVTF